MSTNTLPTPVDPAVNNDNAKAHQHDVVHLPDQMLRVRIIDGELTNLSGSADTYAVISIGKQSARTKVVKNSNRPVYEENFTIGYEREDERSEIVIDVFDKGHLHDERLGEFRLSLAQVDPPKYRKNRNKNGAAGQQPAAANTTTNDQTGSNDHTASRDTTLPNPLTTNTGKNKAPQNGESWANAAPQKAILLSRKGENIGYLNILVRREVRLQGLLNIQINEIDTAAQAQPFWSKTTHIVTKLGQERHESAPIQHVEGQTRLPISGYNPKFQVNDTNNFSDVFIELWQEGHAIAETRLPLYDTRKRYNGSLTFVGPFGGHDVTNTNQKYNVATLYLNSVFEGQHLP